MQSDFENSMDLFHFGLFLVRNDDGAGRNIIGLPSSIGFYFHRMMQVSVELCLRHQYISFRHDSRALAKFRFSQVPSTHFLSIAFFLLNDGNAVRDVGRYFYEAGGYLVFSGFYFVSAVDCASQR